MTWNSTIIIRQPRLVSSPHVSQALI